MTAQHHINNNHHSSQNRSRQREAIRNYQPRPIRPQYIVAQKPQQPSISPVMTQLIQQIIILLIQQLMTQQPKNIQGTSANEVLEGSQQNDQILGGDGRDILYGKAGNDLLIGQGGDDALFGGTGNDTLGTANNGAPWGSLGNDYLNGGVGDDTIFVGTGNNQIIGGAGTDRAIFEGKPTDYQFSLDNLGQLVAKNIANKTTATLSEIETISFIGEPNKSYTPLDIIANPFFSTRKDFMLYGDPALNRMVIMKLSTFEHVATLPINGQKVYSADHVTDDKAYIMPRGSDFVQLLNRQQDGQFLPGKKIDLPFNPRTGAKNKKLGLELISGSNKPMFALIDINSDSLVAVGGRNEVTMGTFDNYDSKWSSGHAVWVSDDQFLFPDRQTKELSLYRVGKNTFGQWQAVKTDSVVTESSIHSFAHKHSDDPNSQTHIIYASTEGVNSNPLNNGGLLELGVVGDKIQLGRTARISAGTHHPEIHPDGRHVYVPTADGKLNIVDKTTMTTVKTIDVGKGAGHVVFIPERNLALIVNHNDTFMTAIDISTHTKIKDIPVARDSPDYNTALQSHTGRVSPDKKYYYNFATDSGTFFRLDLDTLAVDKEIYVGGTPKQAAQPGELK